MKLVKWKAGLLKTKRQVWALPLMATSYPVLCNVSGCCLLWSGWRKWSDKEKPLRDGASAGGTSHTSQWSVRFLGQCAINPTDPALQSLVTVWNTTQVAFNGNLPSPHLCGCITQYPVSAFPRHVKGKLNCFPYWFLIPLGLACLSERADASLHFNHLL